MRGGGGTGSTRRCRRRAAVFPERAIRDVIVKQPKQIGAVGTLERRRETQEEARLEAIEDSAPSTIETAVGMSMSIAAR